MKVQRIAGVVVGTAALFGVCAVAPASAIDNIKGFGVQETLKDFYSLSDFSNEIGYTVKNLRPSGDAVPYPVAGRLYEANVTTDAVVGTVTPQVNNFLARTPGGADYRVLSNVSTLSGAPLGPGGQADGKLYFDVVGENPDSVIYSSGFEDLLGWVGVQPADSPKVDGSDNGGGTSSGGTSTDNGASGVPGSTGPNLATPPEVDYGVQSNPYQQPPNNNNVPGPFRDRGPVG